MSRMRSPETLVALLFIVLGLVLLAGNMGLLILNWSLFWPLILVFFGIWLIWRALSPSPLMAETSMSWGVGNYRPDVTDKELHETQFSHGFGDFDLDLTRAVWSQGDNHVRASHGLGDLTVILPRDMAVRVKASAGLGDVFVLGEKSDGFGPSVTFQSDDYATATRRLDLEASVGLGEVKVMRAG